MQINPIKNILLRLIQACLREQLLPYQIEDSTITFQLMTKQAELVIDGIHIGTLQRITDYQNIIHIEDKMTHIVYDYHEFIAILMAELPEYAHPTQWQNFMAELEDCEQNLHLILQQQKESNHSLLANSMPEQTLMDAVKLIAPENVSLFFERFAMSGHPFHPCHKTCLGFNEHELVAYSPEFFSDVNLYYACIARSHIHIENETADGVQHFFQAHWPKQYAAWQEVMSKLQLNAQDYVPILIHPWQYQQQLPQIFQEELEHKRLIIFPEITVVSAPSLSFRSMSLETEQGYVYCKLPVAIQATSAIRTVSPASVENGSKISKLLHDVLQENTMAASHLRILDEKFAMHIKHQQDHSAKQLGLIMRSDPGAIIKNNEHALVVAALFEKSPLTEQPFLFELMQQTRPIEFIKQYMEKALRAFLPLFLKYGIALEAHQQNTLLIISDNTVQGFAIRDFGGVRIHLPSLNQAGHTIKPYPGSATFTKHRSEARNKLIHTLYQVHLGEIILLLEREAGFDAHTLWQQVRHLTLTIANEMHDLEPAQLEQDINAITNDEWDFKCLLRMRLTKRYSDYLYRKIANPMSLSMKAIKEEACQTSASKSKH